MGSFGGRLKETPVGVRFNPTTLTLVTFGGFTDEPSTPATFPFANVIGTILASGRFAESVSCHHMRNLA
jgi:hypothetical protein